MADGFGWASGLANLAEKGLLGYKMGKELQRSEEEMALKRVQEERAAQLDQLKIDQLKKESASPVVDAIDKAKLESYGKGQEAVFENNKLVGVKARPDLKPQSEGLLLGNMLKQRELTYGTSNDLRKQYEGHPVTKNTDQVSQGYSKLKSAATHEHTPQSDMSLIFGFMKMQDPNSTVREGEYASAKNTNSVPDEVLRAYNQAKDGKILTPKQRENFLKEADGIYNSQLGEQKRIDDQYNMLAQKMSADPTLVTRKFEAPKGLLKSKALSQEDKDALDWANANPNDSRAKAIKQKLGM